MQSNASNPSTIYASANYGNLAFPGPAAYPFYSASQSNTCNVYIPNDSTLSRYASCPVGSSNRLAAVSVIGASRCSAGQVKRSVQCLIEKALTFRWTPVQTTMMQKRDFVFSDFLIACLLAYWPCAWLHVHVMIHRIDTGIAVHVAPHARSSLTSALTWHPHVPRNSFFKASAQGLRIRG